MRRAIPFALALFLAAPALTPSPARAQTSAEKPWLITLSSNYGQWSASGLANSGSQATAFLQAAYGGAAWGGSITGRGARVSYETEQASGKLEFTTLTDTTVATYYLHQRGTVTLRGGVDFMLPTGKHAFTRDELTKVVTDTITQDLMPLNSYGGGLNVNPHLLALWQANQRLTAGIGARYEFTGSYDPVSDTPDDTLDPGDRILGIANAAYALAEGQYLIASFTYSRTGADKQEGQDIYRAGDTLAADARYLRSWTPELTTVVSVSYQTQGKSESQGQGGVLNSELSNSNNNVWEILFNNSWKYSSAFSYLLMAGYKQVLANGYAPGDSLYDGGRTRAFVEPGVTWRFHPLAYAALKARYSYLQDKQDAFAAKDSAYHVFNFDAALVFNY